MKEVYTWFVGVVYFDRGVACARSKNASLPIFAFYFCRKISSVFKGTSCKSRTKVRDCNELRSICKEVVLCKTEFEQTKLSAFIHVIDLFCVFFF